MIYLPKWNFEYGYPHSNAVLQSRLKLERCKRHHATKCDIINDVKLFWQYIDSISQIFDVIQSNVTLQKQVH